MFHEKPQRSLLKSITWFVIEFFAAFLILYWLNRSWQTAVYEAVVINIIKSVLYYAHERIWNKTNFGQELRHWLHLDQVKK